MDHHPEVDRNLQNALTDYSTQFSHNVNNKSYYLFCLLIMRYTLQLLENEVDAVEHPMSAFEPRLYKREAVGYEHPVQYLH